jgi:hypothetical protein
VGKVVTLGFTLALLAACSDTTGDDAGPTNRSDASAATVTTGPDVAAPTTAPTSSDSTSTTPSPSSVGGTTMTPEAAAMSFDELLAQLTDLEGATVDVVGTVFFVASCPPPDSTVPQPCILTGYLAAPERSYLTSSNVGEAIVLSELGRRVSCAEGPDAPGGACPGWSNAAGYRLVGTVVPQVIDGQPTGAMQLDVLTKSTQ